MQVARCGLENEGKCGAGGSASNTLSDLKAATSHSGTGSYVDQLPRPQLPSSKHLARAHPPLFPGKGTTSPVFVPPCLPSSSISFSFRKAHPFGKSRKALTEGRGLFFLLFFSQLTIVCICSAMFYEKLPKFWSSVALLTGTDPAELSLCLILVQIYTCPNLGFSLLHPQGPGSGLGLLA